jgi:pyruvate dehydrogenase E1 component
VAAATSYSVNGVAMLPFYIYYSMFGFQRVGDLIWAAADQRARGFLIGATAGRTTLSGEGLQHQDGTSHLIASTVPNCRAYDPAFSSEVAVIVDHGSRRMLEAQHDEFYYLTVTNENYVQAPLDDDAHADVIKGMRRFGLRGQEGATPAVRLLGSGAILREVIAAADLLATDWDITSEIWSVTSFSELARDARGVERDGMFGTSSATQSHVARCLPGDAPVIAASDYVRAYPQLIASYVEAPYTALGTDGFGRSDTRPALRRFFEVDRYHIALAALSTLDRAKHEQALKRYDIEVGPDAPWNR